MKNQAGVRHPITGKKVQYGLRNGGGLIESVSMKTPNRRASDRPDLSTPRGASVARLRSAKRRKQQEKRDRDEPEKEDDISQRAFASVGRK